MKTLNRLLLIVLWKILHNKDITNLPESCIKMITEKDYTKALECGMGMDESDAKMIISKIEPIGKCVMKKIGGSGPMDEKLP